MMKANKLFQPVARHVILRTRIVRDKSKYNRKTKHKLKRFK